MTYWPVFRNLHTGRPVCLYFPNRDVHHPNYPCNLSPVASSFYSCPLNFFCLDKVECWCRGQCLLPITVYLLPFCAVNVGCRFCLM